jgi:uncharacterized protein YegJ (DUF2314 family)
MARPIPLFAFAFAAYAATSPAAEAADRFASSEDASPGVADGRDLFLATWRMLEPRRANVRVKVCVLAKEGSGEPRLSARASGRAEEVEELWLDEIVETNSGFCGVARMTPERLRHIEPGRKISFELRHIQGWTLDVDAAASETGPASLRADRESRTTLELT